MDKAFSLLILFLVLTFVWWCPILINAFWTQRERRELRRQIPQLQNQSVWLNIYQAVWNFFHPDITKSLDEFRLFVEKTETKYVTVFSKKTLEIYTSDDGAVRYDVQALTMTSRGRVFGYLENINLISTHNHNQQIYKNSEVESARRAKEVGDILVSQLPRQTIVDIAA